MKKKKILFIIWSFTFGGGAERVLATLVNAMPKDKYEIDILEYWHSNINEEKVDDNINILKPVVDSLHEGKVRRVLKMFLLYFAPGILRKKYIKKDYDIEISFNYMIPSFLLRKTGKTIAWVHSDIYDLLDDKYKRLKQKKAWENTDYIVAISEKTYKSIIEIYPEFKNKTVIINNSYDFDSMLIKGNEIKLAKSANVKEILFMGRYDDRKNPLYLVEVLNNLKNKKLKYHVTFMGRGELKDALISKINEYQLSDNITVLDYQKNPYPYIKNADIIASTSKSEGFPTVFVEGMTFGHPFITTEVGGARELSNNGKCGLIAKDIDDYTHKLESLITDKELYKNMSNACVKYVKKYSTENQVKEIEKLISQIK